LAGILIAYTGANWLDPLVSVLIGILILWNAWGILRESVDILLESTPRDIDMSSVVRDLLAIKGVLGVHDLHVWSINQNLRTLSAHILTEDIAISGGFAIQTAINDMLCENYGIGHAILQLECSGCVPDVLYCDMNGQNHSTPA
jgi:cobalt-zinc-cadmium efflux system protein